MKTMRKPKYQQLVAQVVQGVGGVGNVNQAFHCVTRLRFKLADETRVDTEGIKATDGVLDVVQRGGQYQVVIGPQVEEVFDEMIATYPELAAAHGDGATAVTGSDGVASGPVGRFLNMVMEIFQPIMGLLIAAGMIKALLTVCSQLGWLTKTDGTYVVLSAIGDALFYFFPVVLGWSAARRFRLKEVMGITLGAILVYPTLVALTSGKALFTIFGGTIFEQKIYTTFLRIPVVMQSYSTTVIPILLIVWVASKVDHWLNRVIPAIVRSLLVPLLTLLVVAPLALLVIGPVAMVLQDLLGRAVIHLIALNPGIAGLILGALWSLLVVFGLHWGVIPLFAINVATYGYDVINPLIFAGAFASMGAAIGVAIICRNRDERAIAIPAAFSTFFGVNEPTLYGVLIPRQKLMWATFGAAGVGGAIAGFAGAKLYNFTASGPLGAPGFISPNGIDGGFVGMMVGAVVAFALALLAGLAFGRRKDADGGEALKFSLGRKKEAVQRA